MGSVENGFLRDQIAVCKCLYVMSVAMQSIRNIKKSFSNHGIDVCSIYDISLVGKLMYATLCRQEDAAIIEEVINSLKSDTCVLEDLGPREPDIFSPEMT